MILNEIYFVRYEIESSICAHIDTAATRGLTDSWPLVGVITPVRPDEIYQLDAQTHAKVSIW